MLLKLESAALWSKPLSDREGEGEAGGELSSRASIGKKKIANQHRVFTLSAEECWEKKSRKGGYQPIIIET